MAGSKTNLQYRTLEEALEIARALAPRLAEHVPQAEAERRLPDEDVRALLDSGLIALEVPKRYGGAELNLDALIEVTATLSEGCSATGWVYALWAAHMWLIGHYPEHIQAEVFGDSDSLVSSVVNTVGMPEAVEGGFRWTGRGFFSSGVDHCNWLTAAIDLKPNEPPGDRRWFLIPRSDFEIVDDWDTVGLRGTGSKTIVLDDVFIPNERIVKARELSEGRGIGAELHGSPLYCAAMDFTFSLPFAGPGLGIARAALKASAARIRKRIETGTPRQVAEQAATITRLAKATADVDAARALMLATARHFCYIPAAEATMLDRAECRRNVSYGIQLCRAAVNSMFEASGGSGVYHSAELSRLWRDSNVAAAHHGLMWDVHGLAYGRELMGLPPLQQAAL